MATLAAQNLTLADILRSYPERRGEYGVIELLSISNPLYADLQWIQGTGTTEHSAWVRNSIPTPEYGTLGKGTTTDKSTLTEVKENMAYLDGMTKIPEKTLSLAADPSQVMFDQAFGWYEGFAQKWESDFFYGNNITNPQGIKGLANRYNSISTTGIKDNVISAGGSGSDNASIWIINHGPQGIQGIYPKGQTPGCKTDISPSATEVDDGTGKLMKARIARFEQWVGLTVGDYRNSVRIANIDVSDLAGGSAADLLKFIAKGMRAIPIPPVGFGPAKSLGHKEQLTGMGRKTVIYMNRTVYGALEDQANAKTVNGLLLGQADGTDYLTYRGVPIKVCDSLLSTESAVS